LAELLTNLRKRSGLAMPAVIDRLGVPRSTAYVWETTSSRPAPEHLQPLLDLYDATPEERLEAWRLRAAPVDDASVPPSPPSPGEVAHATADHVRAEP
jgi:transcriptional regulator with XRE-family HTH domain